MHIDLHAAKTHIIPALVLCFTSTFTMETWDKDKSKQM